MNETSAPSPRSRPPVPAGDKPGFLPSVLSCALGVAALLTGFGPLGLLIAGAGLALGLWARRISQASDYKSGATFGTIGAAASGFALILGLAAWATV